MTDEAKKFRDAQAEQRAVNIQIKQKAKSTMTAFENANNSYKKGFDAGYEYREKEVQALKQRIEKVRDDSDYSSYGYWGNKDDEAAR